MRKTLIFATVLIFVLIGTLTGCTPEQKAIIESIKKDLAEHVNASPADIAVISIDEVTWSDASLGVPGGFAAQVITPGYVIILGHNNTDVNGHLKIRTFGH